MLRTLDRLTRNRTEGAHGLATAALSALDRAGRRWQRSRPSDLRRRAAAVARALRRFPPAMGVFARWSEEWDRWAAPRAARLTPRRVLAWTRHWQHRLDQELPRILRVARDRLPRHGEVLTISRSGTVRQVLASARGPRRPRKVVVLESRPGGEGRTLARELQRAGLVVELIPDREGSARASRADLLLIGADSIFADGSVLHKVKTRSLALAAQRAGVPVVVAAGTAKYVPYRRSVRRISSWFDRTPARAIREYWTDRGRIPRAGWVRRSRAFR